jgi:hypothetical protein
MRDRRMSQTVSQGVVVVILMVKLPLMGVEIVKMW